jgi:hypothetical protein
MRCASILGLCLFLAPAKLFAQSALDLEIDELSREVKRQLKSVGKDAIKVGVFALGDKDRAPTGAGAGIRRSLIESLRAQKVQVRDDAPWRIEGTFRDADDKRTKGLAIAVASRIVDDKTNGEVGIDLRPRGVFGDASLLMLIGGTVDLPANESRLLRDDRLRISIDTPKASVSEHFYTAPNAPDKEPVPSKAAHAPGSRFRMDVLVKEAGRYMPRPAELERNQAYVRLDRDDVYAVRLINDYDYEIAVQLAVDGIGVFQFAEHENPKTRRPFHSIILAPKSEGVVYGWFVTQKKSDEFLVAEYAKSAAAEMRVISTVGVITATFAACWVKGEAPPLDEPTEAPTFSRELNATARGLRIGTSTEATTREVGVVRGGVSIRYQR